MSSFKKVLCGSALVAASLLSGQQAMAGILSLSDDSFSEQAIGFDFDFFGNTYSSVYVGSNGFLTFGAGDTDFTESVEELLGEEARISVWDDFNPGAGGTVSTSGDANSFTVSYDLVPQFFDSDSNSFDITLFSNGNIEIYFESLNTSDLLVGISAGGGTTGTAVDFSSLSGPFSVNETIYEQFSGSFDLNGQTLSFEVPAPSVIALFALGLAGLGLSRRKAKIA